MSIKKSYPELDVQGIGSRVRYVRKVNNFKTRDFGEILGLSQGQVSTIENGKGKPNKSAIILIGKLFNISTGWLLTGEGEMYVGGGKAGEGEFSQKRIDPRHPISDNKGLVIQKLEEEAEMLKDEIIALQKKMLVQQEESYKLKLENIELRQKNNPGESPAKRQAS